MDADRANTHSQRSPKIHRGRLDGNHRPRQGPGRKRRTSGHPHDTAERCSTIPPGCRPKTGGGTANLEQQLRTLGQKTVGGDRAAGPRTTVAADRGKCDPAGNHHTHIRKKKIVSLASRRTRRSGRFRCNLLNSDADRHSTVHLDAVRHGICLPDGAWQGIFVLDARCQGIFLLDAAMSGHFPSRRSRVRAFSF